MLYYRAISELHEETRKTVKAVILQKSLAYFQNE